MLSLWLVGKLLVGINLFPLIFILFGISSFGLWKKISSVLVKRDFVG